MSYQLDVVALTTACIALYFIIRAKKTYFLDSRFFIGIASAGFIAYLAEATYADITNSPVSVLLDLSLASIMGSSIGFAAYLLKNSDQPTQGGILGLKRFLLRPPLPFLIYLSVVLGWTFAALGLQPWTLTQKVTGGTIYYYYIYPEWFIAASLILLISVITLPVLSLFRQSRTVGENTVSLSMKIISISWAVFGMSLFAQIIAGFLLQTGQSIGFVVDSLLFVMISFALREPTILARIITSGEPVTQAVTAHSPTDTIVLYNTESDRRKLVETFVKDGLATGQNVVCHVAKTEVPFYRAVLKSSDLPELSNGTRSIVIQPIETASIPLSNESTGSDPFGAKRELVDLDELGLERSREVIQNVTAQDDLGKNSIGRIWALNVEGAHTRILDILTARNPKSRVIDLARQQDAFSNEIGRRHQDIVGTRFLLEYEPTSKYEEAVQKFVREFQSNVDPVAVFTSGGSPIYRQFSEQRNIRLFSFSTKTSTPAIISDDQVLLPERDTSLLLDAVDKLLQANNGRRVGIVFEIFTYLILSLGFEKAYGVISSVVEMSESGMATILVLVNSEALEPRVLSGVRGLFQSQLKFDSNGLRATRLGQGENQKGGSETGSTPEFQESLRRIEL